MINNIEAQVTHLSLHHVGNPSREEELLLSSSSVPIEEQEFHDLLLSYFTDSFKDPEYYHFTFIDDEVELNPIYNYASNILDHADLLHEESVKIAKHLYDQSQHHNIKSGDLMVAHLENILIDDELVSGVAIFKHEKMNPFFKVSHDRHDIGMNVEEGIDILKPDKGCLILDTDREMGFKLCIIDRSGTKIEAKYWKEDFLNIKERSDDYHATTQYISMTKSFIKERLPHIDNMDKVDEIDILNKSKRYFEQEESFDKQEYCEKVFNNEEAQQQFAEFSDEIIAYKGLQTSSSFPIHEQAVKKKSRIFKSVLKLDKNFHIYIHGDRSKISKGEDDQGRFYKIYYDEEH